MLSGVKMNLWEVETVKYLSGVYINSLQEYSEEQHVPPYLSKTYEAKLRQRYADQRLASMMQGIKD